MDQYKARFFANFAGALNLDAWYHMRVKGIHNFLIYLHYSMCEIYLHPQNSGEV